MFIKFNSDVIIVTGAIISATLVYYAGNVYGPGLTFDSVNYLYAGVSLAENGKLIRPQAQPYIQWPPLYPFTIALLSAISGNLLQTIFYFQIVITGFTVAISGKLAQHLLQNKYIYIIAYVAIVFSSSLILVNHFIWSESIFVLLTLLYIKQLAGYLNNPSNWAWFVLILIGNLLCLQRLAGVYFIVGSVCLLWFYPSSKFSIHKFWSGCLLGALSVSTLLVWWMYNLSGKGNFFSAYVLIKKSHLRHFLDFNYVFTSWFMPGQFSVWIRIMLVYGIIGFIVYAYLKEKKRKETILPKTDILLLVLMSLFASSFILLYVSINAIDILDDRILAPAYIPGILLFFSLLDRYINTISKSSKMWIVYACAIWSLYPVTRAIYNVHFWHNLPVQLPIDQPVEAAFLEKLKF